MVIREMSREECLRVLAGARLARLACAHENQPYVVPVYLAYHQPSSGEACFYGYTTLGQKVAWMRANPLVCVEVDEVAAFDQWVSVIAIGRYEELPETPGSDGASGRVPERSERQVGEAMPAGSVDSRHREFDDGQVCDGERERAWQVLKTHPMWQEPGCTAWAARAHRDLAEPLIPIFYRIRIDHVTGHEATRDAKNLISYAVPAPLPLGDEAGRARRSCPFSENGVAGFRASFFRNWRSCARAVFLKLLVWTPLSNSKRMCATVGSTSIA
jgi:nitroimidazol reductase NimA-like FMN-containing flavoprotein (pyridoxamine 5'-phosphate oxidase superfamily)